MTGKRENCCIRENSSAVQSKRPLNSILKKIRLPSPCLCSSEGSVSTCIPWCWPRLQNLDCLNKLGPGHPVSHGTIFITYDCCQTLQYKFPTWPKMRLTNIQKKNKNIYILKHVDWVNKIVAGSLLCPAYQCAGWSRHKCLQRSLLCMHTCPVGCPSHCFAWQERSKSWTGWQVPTYAQKAAMTQVHSADAELLSPLKQIIPTLYANTMHSYRYYIIQLSTLLHVWNAMWTLIVATV